MERLAITIQEAVRLTGISRTRLYAALQRGELRARKCGRRTLVEVAALKAWLAAMPEYRPDHVSPLSSTAQHGVAASATIVKQEAGDDDDIF